MVQLNEKSKQILSEVSPILQRVVNMAAEISTIPFNVAEGLRTKERQAELFKLGKTKTLNSKHLTGDAVDLYPLTTDRKKIDENGYKQLSETMKQSAKEIGVKITCGYDWGWDKPHYEL